VRRIARSGSGWTLETTMNDVWQARVVVIATGQYRQPIVPAWPGRESYGGRLLHSTEYANATPYVGQRVLVVGAGNSGAEIAAELAAAPTAGASEGAAFVAISVRTPPPIVPRDPFGMPVQRTGLLLSLLPAALANRFAWITSRLTIGDLTRYGMPAADFAPYTTKRVPLIDVGFVDALKRGRITVRPAVERLSPTGAVFADGTSETFDTIIAATGFRTGLDAMIDASAVPGLLDDLGQPRGTAGAPTTLPGLFFIGFIHSLRGHLFEANLASRRLARHVRDYLDRTTPAAAR
jgi:putative flavoprotein involved in K+ transport